MCAIDFKASSAGSFDLGVGVAVNDNKAINVSNLHLQNYYFINFEITYILTFVCFSDGC